MRRYDVVVIGASWGGLRALRTILRELPDDFPVPIVVAQHRDADAEEDLLAHLLNRRTELCVEDADDKKPLEPGKVLLSPPGYHLLIADGVVDLSVDEPVHFSRPSIDVLFETAAHEYGRRALGVLLTGANSDGAEGLAAIQRRGGRTVVQDPATAERPEMPQAALDAMTPDHVVALDDLARVLTELCGQEVGS